MARRHLLSGGSHINLSPENDDNTLGSACPILLLYIMYVSFILFRTHQQRWQIGNYSLRQWTLISTAAVYCWNEVRLSVKVTCLYLPPLFIALSNSPIFLDMRCSSDNWCYWCNASQHGWGQRRLLGVPLKVGLEPARMGTAGGDQDGEGWPRLRLPSGCSPFLLPLPPARGCSQHTTHSPHPRASSGTILPAGTQPAGARTHSAFSQLEAHLEAPWAQMSEVCISVVFSGRVPAAQQFVIHMTPTAGIV